MGSSNYPHSRGGSLGFYEGNPTTVGCWWSAGAKKVETLTESGWVSLSDHPEDVYEHSLIGLESGSMLLIGGCCPLRSEIWRLEKGNWSVLGNMKKPVDSHSALFIGESIYVIAGWGNNEYPLQRIDLDGEEIKDVEIIGSHENGQWYPVLFHANFDYC